MAVIVSGWAMSFRQARMRRRRLRRSLRIRCLGASSGALPDVLDWVQLRGPRRQEDRRDVVGHVEFARCVLSGAVEDENGVGSIAELRRTSGSVAGRQTPQKSTSRVSTEPGQLQTARQPHEWGLSGQLNRSCSTAWSTAPTQDALPSAPQRRKPSRALMR
jgi:hypothetical protein